MEKYPKIETIFKRDKKGKIIENEYSLPEFEYLRNNKWIFTEKIDGTNIRISVKRNIEILELSLCIQGRTDNSQVPPFLSKKLNNIFNTPKLCEIFNTLDFVLYGEGYGNKIQKMGSNYISNDVDFILFDVKVGKWWLKLEDIQDIANELEIKTVPVIQTGTLIDMVKYVKNGFDSFFGNFIAEGIVARPEINLLDRAGNRIITKLKYKDFKHLAQNKL